MKSIAAYSAVLLASITCSSAVFAQDSGYFGANLGMQFQVGNILSNRSGGLGKLELGSNGLTSIQVVGNAETGFRFGGENRNLFGLFAGVNAGNPFNDGSPIYLGAELLNYGNHNLDFKIESFSVVYQGDDGGGRQEGFSSSLQYQLGYAYRTQNWNVTAQVHDELRSKGNTPESDPNFLNFTLSAHRSMPVPQVFNSELIMGISLAASSSDYANYQYGVNDDNRYKANREGLEDYSLDFAASATVNAGLVVPLANNWLLTGNVAKEFLSEDLANSPVLDDFQSWSASTGVRYVF